MQTVVIDSLILVHFDFFYFFVITVMGCASNWATPLCGSCFASSLSIHHSQYELSVGMVAAQLSQCGWTPDSDTFTVLLGFFVLWLAGWYLFNVFVQDFCVANGAIFGKLGRIL